MRYYFGEYGWPSSKMGGPPQTDAEKENLVDSLQVGLSNAISVVCDHECRMG